MPIFTGELEKTFRANHGAYSQVTHREATGDKSVTLDINEKNVIHSLYGSSTFDRKGGALTSNSPYKMFQVHDAKGGVSKIALSVVYPKSTGNELRLYYKSGQFDPEEGDYWYIFTRDGEDTPHIGWKNRKDWEQLLSLDSKVNESGIRYNSLQQIDDEDEEYQKQVGAAEVKLPVSSTVMKYQRDPSIAQKALRASGYVCEAVHLHTTFIGVSGNPFVECHHLIPVSMQQKFPSASLDVEENIVTLCPNCHRHVHLGVGESKREILDKLWNARKEGLERRGIEISYEEFLLIYF